MMELLLAQLGITPEKLATLQTNASEALDAVKAATAAIEEIRQSQARTEAAVSALLEYALAGTSTKLESQNGATLDHEREQQHA